jgi:hypothetical protein
MHLLLLALALAAPVPKDVHKPQKPPEPTAGVWTLVWSGMPYTATLSNANGEFSEFLGEQDRLWVGTWNWDAATRTLSVGETCDGGDYWLRWSAVLDGDLRGKTDGGTTIHLKPFRAPATMPSK